MAPPLTAVRDTFSSVPLEAYQPTQRGTIEHATRQFANAWFLPDSSPVAAGKPRQHFYHAPPQGPQFIRHKYTFDNLSLDVFESSQYFLVWVGPAAPEPALETIRQIALRLFAPYPVSPESWRISCIERAPSGDMYFTTNPELHNPTATLSPFIKPIEGGVTSGKLYFELKKMQLLLPYQSARAGPVPLDEFIPHLRPGASP